MVLQERATQSCGVCCAVLGTKMGHALYDYLQAAKDAGAIPSVIVTDGLTSVSSACKSHDETVSNSLGPQNCALHITDYRGSGFGAWGPPREQVLVRTLTPLVQQAQCAVFYVLES